MSMLGTATPQPVALAWRKALASRWLWCLAAVLFIGGRDLFQSFGDLLTSLGDTDDATRLTEVRRLLAGASWFDMSLPRIGGETPLISHWSRLIDVPLAVLLQLFGLILTPANAELLTRIVWPLVVLFLFLRVGVRAIETQASTSAGNTTAAALLLVLAVTCMTGLYQFRIGRIDHHNGMISGSIGGLLLLLNARRVPHDGLWAGLLIGLGLSVGYEPLAFLLPALGAAALWAVIDMTWLPGVRRMAVALAASLGAIFLATVAPSLWFNARCDALSLNMVLLAGAGAASLAVVDVYGRTWSTARRIAVLAGAGAVGATLYGTLDPRCLAGPFGQVDPALKAVWLDHVTEGFNVFTFFSIAPLSVVAFAGTMTVGFWAAIERWRRLRTPETLVLLVLLAMTAPTGVWMIKLTPYASWVAVFAVALSLADLKATEQLTALSRQIIGATLASQWAFMLAATPLLSMLGTSPALLKADSPSEGAQCMTTQAFSALAPLPKGFVVGPIDFGPFIVALTHHDVLAAPYHRIDQAILKNQAILGAEPAAARLLLKSVHADYVVLCLPKQSATIPAAATSTPPIPLSLEARLKAGQAISYLTPVAIDSPIAELKVWRVLR